MKISEALKNYRIQADMAFSEVKDGFHTQAEYEKALEKIKNCYTKEIYKALEAEAGYMVGVEDENGAVKAGKTYFAQKAVPLSKIKQLCGIEGGSE